MKRNLLYACIFITVIMLICALAGCNKPAIPPVTEPTTDPVTEPMTDPITEPVTEPVTEPMTDLATEPATAPITEPVTEPVFKEIHRSNKDFHYTITTDNTITINWYYGASEHVVIPNYIDGLPVTRIYTTAFRGEAEQVEYVPCRVYGNEYEYEYEYVTIIPTKRAKIKSIVLPDTLTTIDFQAFEGCQYLEEIYIPDSVVDIGFMAFSACLSLHTVRLPANLESIPDFAFYFCESLKTIDIPDSVKTIGYNAFAESGLTEIDLKNVESICEEAFSFCKELEKVTLSPKMTTIQPYLFEGCQNLQEIVIPEGVEVIEKCAFIHSGLENIVLPSTVTHIYTGAFDYPHLSEGVLRNVVLPESLIYLGDYNFYSDNYNYTYENGAYYLGTADNPYFLLCKFDSNSKVQLIHPDTKIIAVTQGHNGSDITVPDGVTVIMKLRLQLVENKVNKITIPASVKYLYEGAFSSNLNYVLENPELVFSKHKYTQYDPVLYKK